MLILLNCHDFPIYKGIIILVQNTTENIINSFEIIFYQFIFLPFWIQLQLKEELDLSLSYQSFRSPLAWNIRSWFISELDILSEAFQSHCHNKSGKLGTPFATSLIFLPWQINRIHTELGRCSFKETRFQECKTVNNIKNANSITVSIFLEATDASCCEWCYWNPYIREKKEYLADFTLITPTNAPWISPLYLLTTFIPGWKYFIYHRKPTLGKERHQIPKGCLG